MVQRRVTLADVAERAGVSTALVSIVMREAPGASAVSRMRIQAVARELGYRPDVRARALASLTSHVIGVVFGVGDRFHFALIDGLYGAAGEFGWDIVLSAVTSSRDEKRALDSLHDVRCDALVMLGPPVASPLLAGEVPVVVIGWSVDHPDVDVVRTSDEHGMHLAVSHLVERGHRRIAHFEGGTGLVAASRRLGYESAMADAGLHDEIHIIHCGGEGHLEGQRAARAMLQSTGPLPTGIVAFNDDLAVAAITVLRMQGLDVPGDVSVVGFDNSTLARSAEIDLTSVTQEPQEMARLAVERLIARAEKREVGSREIVLRPELRVRSSTAPVSQHEHGRRPNSSSSET